MNLIGDHTDYTRRPRRCRWPSTSAPPSPAGGADDRRRAALGRRSTGAGRPRARSTSPTCRPGSVEPAWGRYVAGVVAELAPDARASTGTVTHHHPGRHRPVVERRARGRGRPRPRRRRARRVELAQPCQRAEQLASGVPCGLMDQLASARRRRGPRPADRLPRRSTVEPVPVPDGVAVVVVHSGQERELAGSAYAERRAAVRGGRARSIGPLRDADARRPRRHRRPGGPRPGPATSSPRTTGCARFADALRAGDVARGRRAHGREPRQLPRRLRGLDPGRRRARRPARRHARASTAPGSPAAASAAASSPSPSPARSPTTGALGGRGLATGARRRARPTPAPGRARAGRSRRVTRRGSGPSSGREPTGRGARSAAGGADAPPEQVLAVDEHDRGDRSSSATWRSRERVGLARREHQVGAERRGLGQRRSPGSGPSPSAKTLSMPSAREQRRAVGVGRHRHPRPAPDGTNAAPPVDRRTRGGVRTAPGAASTPDGGGQRGHAADRRRRATRCASTCEREAGGDERVGVLAAVLLVAHHHEVGRERDDGGDVGVLGAADRAAARAARRSGSPRPASMPQPAGSR